jgi:hypothetical protein
MKSAPDACNLGRLPALIKERYAHYAWIVKSVGMNEHQSFQIGFGFPKGVLKARQISKN